MSQDVFKGINKISKEERNPERRVFYVDVSGMNPKECEKYIQDLIPKYKYKVPSDIEWFLILVIGITAVILQWLC